MDQAVIELAMEEHLAREHGIYVQYSTECLNLQVEETIGEHSIVDLPITLKIARTREGLGENAVPASTMTMFKAKYLVGADGSRSWTRSQVGINMLGAQTSKYPPQQSKNETNLTILSAAQSWGVADIVPMSDFRKNSPSALLTLF
jgi:2-polyprenyl-6-methoxyphenol hydroxylase-like FAD-dependent oxidoreductase